MEKDCYIVWAAFFFHIDSSEAAAANQDDTARVLYGLVCLGPLCFCANNLCMWHFS